MTKKYTGAAMYIRVNITPENDGRSDYKNSIVKEIHISIDDLRIICSTAKSAGTMVEDQVFTVLHDIEIATEIELAGESEGTNE